jgi:DNA-binding transcriptional LysR family regulator
MHSIAPVVVRRLRDAVPGVTVTLGQFGTPELVHALRAGEVDVGITRGAIAVPPVTVEPIAHEQLMLAVASTHRLASSDAVGPADTRDEPSCSGRGPSTSAISTSWMPGVQPPASSPP